MVALANPILDEIEYWSRLGVPVLPGALGQKGAWPKGWPDVPAAETWALSRLSAARPSNLAVRLGPTADGSRVLAHIDLDGKCPCGGDLTDHETGDGRLGACHGLKCQQRGCECQHYAGVAPDEALARLKALLPELPLLIKTRRGYRAYFWSPREYPASVLPQFGADVAANSGALSVIPPSVHPSGARYEYHKPLHDLPLIDLEAIGLQPVSKGQPRGASTVRRPANDSSQILSAAPTEVQGEFLELLRLAGACASGRIGDEAHVCPWHADTEASLSVHAEASLFHCFGCGEGGGIRRLRKLVGIVPPTCNPFRQSHEGPGRGFQLGGERAAAERDRLADALKALGERDRSERMQQCREHGWDSPEALEALACPSGDATPVRFQTNSCDDPQCSMCMPWRLAAYWRTRWSARDEAPPEHLTLVTLDALACSDGLEDRAYTTRTRSQFREWRRARAINAGFCGFVLQREGTGWRARLLLAISDADADKVADGRAFTAHVVERGASSRALIRAWQQAYLEEASAWTSLEELEALRLMTRGRRKFQGWGDHFGGERTGQEGVKESEVTQKEPLHQMSGGSGGGAKKSHTCPRCGDRLRVVGPFDPERMEIVQGDDGLREWRWKPRQE